MAVGTNSVFLVMLGGQIETAEVIHSSPMRDMIQHSYGLRQVERNSLTKLGNIIVSLWFLHNLYIAIDPIKCTLYLIVTLFWSSAKLKSNHAFIRNRR